MSATKSPSAAALTIYLLLLGSLAIAARILPILRANREAVAAPLPDCRVVGTVEAVSGRARLSRSPESDRPLRVGTPLCVNDTVELESQSRVLVRCRSNNERRSVPAGLRSRAYRVCPTARRCDDGNCGQGSESVETATPRILSPRHTAIADRAPILRWRGIPGVDRYWVRIRQLGQAEIVWEAIVSSTQIEYSGHPPLEPGAYYELQVGAIDRSASDLAEFNVLDPGDLPEMGTKSEPGDCEVAILENVTFYRDLYLRAAAIAYLEAAIAEGIESAAIYRELGDLYWRIELPDEAEEPYLRGIQQAETSDRFLTEALLRARLAELYCFLNRPQEANRSLEQASALYQREGKSAIAAELTSLACPIP